MKIGDSNFHTLDKIWNSDRRKHILEKVNPQIHCKFHCIRHESNLLLEEMMKGKKLISLRITIFFYLILIVLNNTIMNFFHNLYKRKKYTVIFDQVSNSEVSNKDLILNSLKLLKNFKKEVLKKVTK